MGNMVQRAKTILRGNRFTALYDKGYHTGSEIKTAILLGVEPIVAIPAVSSAGMAPDPAYNVSEFVYDPATHSYTCPQGHQLTTNGSWYNKERKSSKRKTGTAIKVQHFKTKACKHCPVLNLCTKNTRGRGRVIERSEYQAFVDINRKNVEEKESLYQRRQAIIEHNYGTIKRQWNFHYIITKRGIDRASADVGSMFTAYNLRRIFNLIDKKALKEYMRALIPCFYRCLAHMEAFLSPQDISKILYPAHRNFLKLAA